MAAAYHPNVSSELHKLTSLVKTLTNVQLREILRSEGLAVSGVKLSLQLRVIDYIERLYQDGQTGSYERVKRLIYSLTHRSIPVPASTHAPQQYPSNISNLQHKTATTSPGTSNSMSTGRLNFKDSPFFSIIEPLTPVVECKVREHTRDTVELKVTLNATVAGRLQSDPNTRVMIYCAADTGLNQFSKSDISFPHQVELKVNLDEVKANLRGLKNKPGSTRPADVTNYIRKKPGYPNHVVLTYALTQKRFFVVANLVQRRLVGDLVAELKARKTIPKEQVIKEMRNRADDADIVATSSVLSLKCPLSTLRIEVPCRSMVCTHNQCFDASSFLQLQEQAPTWTCPICNKATSFESLQIDRYVKEILESTSSEIEQVTLGPRGDWYYGNGQDHTNGHQTPDILGGDDLIEIANPSPAVIKREPSFDRRGFKDSPIPARPPSFSSPRPSGGKRSMAMVIDLTGSDDDDDIQPKQKLSESDSQHIRTYPTSSSSTNNNKRIKLSGISDSMSPSSSIDYYSP